MEAKIRRLRSLIYSSGLAVITLCVWSMGKMLLMMIWDMGSLKAAITGLVSEEQKTLAIVLYFVIVAVVTILFMFVIGFSATAEGKGKKKSPFYLVLIIIYLAVEVFSLIGQITQTNSPATAILVFVYGLIDLSIGIALMIIFVSSIQLRKLTR